MIQNKSLTEIEQPSLKAIIDNQKGIVQLLLDINTTTQTNLQVSREVRDVVQRIARRSKPQRKEGLWNWAKDTAKGIFHVGAETFTIASIVSGITEINGLIGALSQTITAELVAQTDTLTGINGEQTEAIAGYIDENGNEQIKDRKDTYDRMENFTNKKWKDGQKEIAENLDATKKDLSHLIPDIVANRVVGQSYNVWDGTCKYKPTLKFSFTEITERMLKRKAEISVRLNVEPNDINPRYCKQLGRRIIEQDPWIYTRGPNRYFYVDLNKNWKTTMYVTGIRPAQTIMNAVCNVLQIPFEPNQGSYTTKKPRRRIGLMDPAQTEIPANTMNMDVEFRVQLYRAVILLNGATSPITIYARRETGPQLFKEYLKEKKNGNTA